MEVKFYICETCGKIVAIIKDSRVPLVCCGKPMKQLTYPGTFRPERHIPVPTVEGRLIKVLVGNGEHPMTDEHSIEWISIETKEGRQRKILSPGDKPYAEFMLTDSDEFVSALAYCNLHGLWKSE